jgi:hypothetical protein
MLIHISPRFYTGPYAVPVQLVDVTVEQLGLVLRDGVDLVMRQPFPNKRIYVASRKTGRKAMNGLLIDTGEARVKEFDVITRWAVFAGEVVTHRVKYVVLDEEFDAVSAEMVLWRAMCESLGGWESRMPALPSDASPASHMPRMAIIPEDREQRTGDVVDKLNGAGMVKERVEVFSMPTIQPARLENRRLDNRLPCLEDAFKIPRAGADQRLAV